MTNRSILLLDPYKNLLLTYRAILEGQQFSVDTAAQLEEAFEKCASKQYSVLITEYLSPFEEICRMIQWLKGHSPGTYIMMVTHADIDETTYEALFEIGLDDLIFKPYPAEKILVHIRKGLKQMERLIGKQEAEKESLLDPVAAQIQQPIFNTSYFKKCLRQEIKRAKRHKHPLSLLIVKIPSELMGSERFEPFCRELARVLRTYTREEDLVGREDGNFGILLPETDRAGSDAVLKRLARLVRTERSIQSDETLQPYTQTVSFQSFTYPEEFVIPESLMSVVKEIDREYCRN